MVMVCIVWLSSALNSSWKRMNSASVSITSLPRGVVTSIPLATKNVRASRIWERCLRKLPMRATLTIDGLLVGRTPTNGPFYRAEPAARRLAAGSVQEQDHPKHQAPDAEDEEDQP